ncbi:MAG: hypothetical protein RLZZ417_1616 [Bacteroidota bacterium]|jgi:hypothetical protein
MKNIILVYLGVFLFCVKSEGQQFKGSIVSGLTLAQIDGDLLSGFNQPGLRAGLHLDSRINDRWSLAMEMAFSQAGSRRQLTDSPAAILHKIRLNQVEVPLVVQFTEWKFKVGTGIIYQRLFNYALKDISGTDVTNFYSFRNNHVSFIAACTVQLNDRWGILLSWSKSMNALQTDNPAIKFRSRVIGIQSIIYL